MKLFKKIRKRIWKKMDKYEISEGIVLRKKKEDEDED